MTKQSAAKKKGSVGTGSRSVKREEVCRKVRKKKLGPKSFRESESQDGEDDWGSFQ